MAHPDPSLHLFADDGRIPNNAALPVIVYRRPLALGDDPAAALEETFARSGWSNGWSNGIYGFHHFHSTAHEVLGIARGRVRVQLGGEWGIGFDLGVGDVVVVPAGTGHRNEGDAGGLVVVGAYAGGRGWDTRTGEPDERVEVLRNIAAVPLPDADPVLGADGPLMRAWRRPS